MKYLYKDLENTHQFSLYENFGLLMNYSDLLVRSFIINYINNVYCVCYDNLITLLNIFIFNYVEHLMQFCFNGILSLSL